MKHLFLLLLKFFQKLKLKGIMKKSSRAGGSGSPRTSRGHHMVDSIGSAVGAAGSFACSLCSCRSVGRGVSLQPQVLRVVSDGRAMSNVASCVECRCGWVLLLLLWVQ